MEHGIAVSVGRKFAEESVAEVELDAFAFDAGNPQAASQGGLKVDFLAGRGDEVIADKGGLGAAAGLVQDGLGVGPGVQAGGRKENGQQGQADGSDERAVHNKKYISGGLAGLPFFSSRKRGRET